MEKIETKFLRLHYEGIHLSEAYEDWIRETVMKHCNGFITTFGMGYDVTCTELGELKSACVRIGTTTPIRVWELGTLEWDRVCPTVRATNAEGIETVIRLPRHTRRSLRLQNKGYTHPILR